MTEDAPILLRLGDENSYRILKLDKNEVSIGSAEDATYSISAPELSQSLVVMRRHDETWTITDIMSSNSIYLNGHHLVPLSSYAVQDGDLVQFGDPASFRGQRKFEYKFCNSFTAENILQSKKLRELEEHIKDLEQQMQKQNMAMKRSNKIQELEVKKNELELQLRNLNLAVEMILMDRQRERASLLAEIDESHKQSIQSKQHALQVKNDVLTNFTELMDVTVQCSICTEYFIKATGLNCSHVFCNLCINEWMKVKKLCPNCRTPITAMMQIPALDKCIDRMVEQFSDDIRGHRQELINQRKVAENKNDDANDILEMYYNALNINMEPIAAFVREIARTAVAHTRPATIRRTAALMKAEAMTRVRALRRSQAARKAAELTKKTVQKGAQVFKNAKRLTTTRMRAGAAVLKRALTLAKAAAKSKSNELTKSAIFRKAAALAKTVATTGAETLSKSTLLRRAAELASASARGGYDVLTKSLLAKRAAALTRALIKSERVKRTTARIKAYAVAGVAKLKNSAVYTRTIALAQGEPAPGILAQGEPAPGILAQGERAPGILAQGEPAPGILAQGERAPGILAQGVPAPGILAQGEPAPGILAQGVPAPGILAQGKSAPVVGAVGSVGIQPDILHNAAQLF